jgi:hypothetical protein
MQWLDSRTYLMTFIELCQRAFDMSNLMPGNAVDAILFVAGSHGDPLIELLYDFVHKLFHEF